MEFRGQTGRGTPGRCRTKFISSNKLNNTMTAGANTGGRPEELNKGRSPPEIKTMTANEWSYFKNIETCAIIVA